MASKVENLIAKFLLTASGLFKIGAIVNGEFLKRSGNNIISAPGAGGGPPGTWTQLGKGPTLIAKATETTVLADQTLAAGEVPWFSVIMKTTPTAADVHHSEFATDVAPGFDEADFSFVKKTNGKIDYRIHWDQSGAPANKDFDWVAHKVLPS